MQEVSGRGGRWGRIPGPWSVKKGGDSGILVLVYDPPEERLHTMITNPALLRAFEHDEIRTVLADHARNLAIVEALYEEARLLGVWPPADMLDGIEVDLRLAKALNVRPTP